MKRKFYRSFVEKSTGKSKPYRVRNWTRTFGLNRSAIELNGNDMLVIHFTIQKILDPVGNGVKPTLQFYFRTILR